MGKKCVIVNGETGDGMIFWKRGKQTDGYGERDGQKKKNENWRVHVSGSG